MKGKFVKKLMACALAVSMVVSIPFTASAADFKDFFWISDGNEEHDKEKDPNGIGTGTVTSTNTATTALKENSQLVTGIEIKEAGKTDAASSVVIDLAKGKTADLVAEVQYAEGSNVPDEVKKAMNKKIAWSSSNLNIIRPTVRAGSRQNCKVTAYRGGVASMTASIDVDADGTDDFYAMVMIKATKAVTALSLNKAELYAGHTYDLMDYVTFGSPEEYDTVTFTVTLSDSRKAKLVTWTKDGTLKLDKKIKNKDGLKVTIKAEANGKTDEETFNITEGNPVKKLTLSNTKPAYAIDEDYKEVGGEWVQKANPKELTVTAAANDTSKSTTDEIAWSSSDSRIVEIKVDEKDDTKITFVGKSVGKATITATATSGKSAKATVTVTAKLLAIESASVKGDVTYSGKTTPLIIERIPKENRDKLKITVTDKDEKKIVKVKAGITPTITPVADITTKLKADGKEITTVKIEPANKKGTSVGSEGVKVFTVKQSDVKLTDVKGVLDGKPSQSVDKKTISMNSGRTVNYIPSCDPATGIDMISWLSSNENVATVDNGRVSVIGDGSAKITVSSVYKNGNKYVTAKKAFTIKSTPKCESIELKSNLITVKKGKAAVINVKQQLPKKAADTVTWEIWDESNGKLEALTADGKKINNKKCTIDTAKYNAGDVITVIATAGSAKVEAKIIVTK